MSRKRKLMCCQLILANCALKIIDTNKRRWGIRPVWRKRRQQGQYYSLIKSLRDEDSEYFKKFLRVTPEEFNYLKKIIKPHLPKKKKTGRKPISVGQKLALTLRFLSSGDSYISLGFAFRLGFSTVGKIVPEVLKAIWNSLGKIYLKNPIEDDWSRNADGYFSKWQFPNCVGSVDGKHVVIQCPSKSGSAYYNYKGDFSIVLMAVVDASYKFTVIDVGSYGSVSDGGTFRDSNLGKAIFDETIRLPTDKELPFTNVKAPFVFIGDEAFQLRENFMRPFPGRELDNSRRIFNYRLSRARRCVENAFGIMSNRFRIFRRPINLPPTTVDLVIKASCVLHNYLRYRSELNTKTFYSPTGYGDYFDNEGNLIEGEWRKNNSSTCFISLKKNFFQP